MEPAISVLEKRLHVILDKCMEEVQSVFEVRRSEELPGYEWAFFLRNDSLEFSCFIDETGGLVGDMKLVERFLNFRVSEVFLWEMEMRSPVAWTIELETSLRDAGTAAALKAGRKTLKQFRKRLAGLENRRGGKALPGRLSDEMHMLVAAQWHLEQRLAEKEGAWGAAGLGKALERYGRALTRCWGLERVEVAENAEQTARQLHIWASQNTLIEKLLQSTSP